MISNRSLNETGNDTVYSDATGDGGFYGFDTRGRPTAMWATLIVLPVLVLCGTLGNSVTLVVLRTGELKVLSTCFYMSVLAVADTG